MVFTPLTATAVSLILLLSADVCSCQRYIVPEATLEFLSPRGLKISIPDIDKGVSLVAFHINVNEEFFSLEHGQWGQDIIKKREGKWSYFIPDFKVKQGDTIYYWIYVIVDNLGYHGLDRVYKVNKANPHGSTSAQPAPTTTTTTTTAKPSKRPPPEFSPDRYPEVPNTCRPSLTSRDGGISSCQGQVILDKHFNNLDGWLHEVHIGGDQPDDEFTVFTKDSATSKIEKNELVIRPILLEEKYNDTFVRAGSLTLDGCTSSTPDHCTRQGVAFLILPPVMSARLTTKNSFTFHYGTIEIRAKLPSGDWIVPELWLEPKASSSAEPTGRIVIAMARGNTNFNTSDNNWLLETGLVMDSSSQLVKKTSERKWSRDYHTFKLLWNQDVMIFSVDGEEVSRIQTSGEQWLEREFYLTLGVHVAGSRDFSDNTPNKPWKNTNPKRFVQFWESKNVWHPSWTSKSELRVQSVKVTAL